jgi:crotonobetainyl-CoA:carnitine CoA-transferase CaiB-like acyl-CoA transferase
MDDVIQGASGIAGLQALYSQGPPTYVPLVIVDRVCAINAAQVILAALFMRERTGRGQHIEVPMFETIAQIVMGDHLGGETFDPPAGPMGYTRLLTPHRRPFKTRDGYIALLVYTDRHWQQFFEAVGQPQKFKDDPRFTTAAMRSKHHDIAYAMLSEYLLERTTGEWVKLLQEVDIPCLPLHDLRGLLSDPHLEEIDFFTMMDHPSEGRVRTMRVASAWSDAELSIQRHAPRVGEQSTEILREAGFSEERINRLLTGDAVVQDLG